MNNTPLGFAAQTNGTATSIPPLAVRFELEFVFESKYVCQSAGVTVSLFDAVGAASDCSRAVRSIIKYDIMLIRCARDMLSPRTTECV